MYYYEYAIAAKHQYKSCNAMYMACKSGAIPEACLMDILHRIYYLCGHVIECVAVYLIYKHFRWSENVQVSNWAGRKEHIHVRFNFRFTIDSHVDFFPVKLDDNDPKSIKFIRKCKEHVRYSKTRDLSQETFYCIQNHKFQQYIKGVICTQLPQDAAYFRGYCEEDKKFKPAIELLDWWTSDLRYYYDKRDSGHYNGTLFTKDPSMAPQVNLHNIGLLLELCEQIISKLQTGSKL